MCGVAVERWFETSRGPVRGNRHAHAYILYACAIYAMKINNKPSSSLHIIMDFKGRVAEISGISCL